jgi:hypothetical protein
VDREILLLCDGGQPDDEVERTKQHQEEGSGEDEAYAPEARLGINAQVLNRLVVEGLGACRFRFQSVKLSHFSISFVLASSLEALLMLESVAGSIIHSPEVS